MKYVGIVMPTLTQFELGLKALQSVVTKHRWTPFIIPNWEKRMAVTVSWNLGINQAIRKGADYILVVNDDILFSPWTIDGLVSYFESADDSIAIVTGHNVRGQIENPDDIFSWPCPEFPNVDEEHPDFACFMIKPSTIENIGNFDENFTPAYFEDNDYHRRINLLGYKARFTASAPYYHYGSRTQNNDSNIPVVPPFAFELNRAYYINKWQGDVGSETALHPYGNESLSPKHWIDENGNLH
jgi:GT2 family glycosyltransferase